jgi:two-component system, sensor histidine kinase
MIDVILRENLPDRVRSGLELARSSAATVLSLLNDLLDLSRIEQDKLELQRKPCRIRELLGDLVQTYERQVGDKEISFGLSVDTAVPDVVLCDPNRLGQVLKNLLSNAIKFTESGSIRIEVRDERGTDRKKRLGFRVIDTGIGIPQEMAEEVFLSFTQVDPTYSKKFAGAGLGLSISRKLVELMGGEIKVKSTVGSGTTFSFTILYDKSLAREEQQPCPMSLSDLPPLSILLAEDNRVNRIFLKRALTSAGHEVDEAENGAQAVELLARRAYDVVLMDIQMPEMDGLEASRKIRSMGNGSHDTPIIALTAYAMKGDREKFLSQGMNGYVTKPVDFSELARAIAEACGVGDSDPEC